MFFSSSRLAWASTHGGFRVGRVQAPWKMHCSSLFMAHVCLCSDCPKKFTWPGPESMWEGTTQWYGYKKAWFIGNHYYKIFLEVRLIVFPLLFASNFSNLSTDFTKSPFVHEFTHYLKSSAILFHFGLVNQVCWLAVILKLTFIAFPEFGSPFPWFGISLWLEYYLV